MTLNELIVAALSELGRGHDQKSIDNYRHKFTRFANDALCDIASSMELTMSEQARITGSIIDTLALSHKCLKVLAVIQDGFPLRFSQYEASNMLCVRGTGLVDVIYRYMPLVLTSPSDVPEIPEYMHGLIVDYIVGRERMSGDSSTQGGASAHMQLYEKEKMRFMSAFSCSGEIKNKW